MSLAGRVLAVLALALGAAGAHADMTPAQAAAALKGWRAEAARILAAQPKDSAARTELDLWLKEQGASFGRIAEPLRSASVPSKLWGSAAYALDTANRNAGSLNEAEYRGLLALSQDIIGACRQAYAPRQSVCTDGHYWDLRLQNALYLAKLDGTDRDAHLASLPGLVAEAGKPLSGAFAPVADVARQEACRDGIRGLARHLRAEYDPYGRGRSPGFHQGYFAAAQAVLAACEPMPADDALLTGHLAELGVSAAARAGDDAGLRAQAEPLAQRAYALLLAQQPTGDGEGAHPVDLARLLVLADTLGKREDARRWAQALPVQLRLDAESGGAFPCNYFGDTTANLGAAWTAALAKFPDTGAALAPICP